MLREDSPECEEEEEEEEEAAQSREVGMEEELEREVERRKRTPSGRRTPVCGRHRYWGEKWENAICQTVKPSKPWRRSKTVFKSTLLDKRDYWQ